MELIERVAIMIAAVLIGFMAMFGMSIALDCLNEILSTCTPQDYIPGAALAVIPEVVALALAYVAGARK